MKSLLVFLVFFLSFTFTEVTLAGSLKQKTSPRKIKWGYKKLPILKRQKGDYLPRRVRVGRKTLLKARMQRGSATHPYWGIEQLYTDVRLKKIVAVKKQVLVSGENVVGGWRKLNKGYVLHLKRGKNVTAYFTQGLSHKERYYLERKMRRAHKVAHWTDLFFKSAYASEVTGGGGNNVTDSAQPRELTGDDFGPRQIAVHTAKCVGSSVAEGAVDAVGNSWEGLKSAGSSVRNAGSALWNDFGGSMQNVGNWLWDKGEAVVDAGGQAVNYVGEAITDPSMVRDDIMNAVNQTVEVAQRLYQALANTVSGWDELPGPIKAEIMCMGILIGGPTLAAGLLAWTGVGSAMSARLAAWVAGFAGRVAGVIPQLMQIWNSASGSVQEKMTRIRQTWTNFMEDESSGSPAPVTTAGAVNGNNEYVGFRNRYPDQSARNQAMAANRALNDSERISAIEEQLGVYLSPAQRQRLLEIHNVPCAAQRCTAQEIRDLKDLRGVMAMFPDVPRERVLDLYRSNLLGGEEVDMSEFADLLNRPAFPRAPRQTPDEIRAARLSGMQDDLNSIDERIAQLQSNPNHSAIEMADLRRRRNLLLSAIAREEVEQTDVDMSEFEALLQQPVNLSRRDADAPEGEAVEIDPDSRLARDAYGAKAAEDDQLSDVMAAVNQEITDADREEFQALLRMTGIERPVLERAHDRFERATENAPELARYVSPSTGEMTEVRVIGVGEGEGLDQLVRVRVRTGDGRVVTRNVRMGTLIPDGEADTLQAISGPSGTQGIVDEMARNATSDRERIRELDGEIEKASRDRDMAASIRLTNERDELARRDTPLRNNEVDAIQAVSEAFTAEGVAERIPLNVLPNGQIQIRPGYNGRDLSFTAEEMRDFERLQSYVDARRGAARAEEDQALFQRVSELNPNELLRQRALNRQRQLSREMAGFTGNRSRPYEIPRFAEYRQYDPRSLSQAYGTSSSIRQALETVDTIIRSPSPTLGTQDISQLNRALGTLTDRRYQNIINENPALRDYLNFAANRAAESSLRHMRDGL